MELYSSSPLFWTLACFGVIMTGISKSGFAGGAGVLAVPILSFVMPIPHAAFLMLPLLLVMDVKSIQYYYKAVGWSELKAIIPASIIGVGVGGFALGVMPTLYLQLMLGGLCVAFGFWHQLAPFFGSMRGAGWVWGGIGGFTSTLIHAGGPPINIYLVAKAYPKQTWLAIAAIFFAVINVIKLVPYSLSGQWSTSLIYTSIVLIPVALFGAWLGKRVQERFSEKTFMKICRFLLISSGLSLLGKSLINM